MLLAVRTLVLPVLKATFQTVPHARGFTEGHVSVFPLLGEDTLLTMPATELVPNDRVAVEPHLNIDPLQVRIFGADDGDLIDDCNLLTLQISCLGFACRSVMRSSATSQLM